MLGDKLKEIRESRNMGLNELSRLCGVSAGYISALERNEKHNPSQNTLKKIAEALDISMESLFNLKFESSDHEVNTAYEKDSEQCFKTPNEAVTALLNSPSIMSYCDYDINLLSKSEINKFADDLLEQLKLLTYKYKRWSL